MLNCSHGRNVSCVHNSGDKMASISELYAAEQKAKAEEEAAALGATSTKEEANDDTVRIDCDNHAVEEELGETRRMKSKSAKNLSIGLLLV